MPWLNSASDLSRMYVSIGFQYPLSSLTFLQLEQIGSSPLRVFVSDKASFGSSVSLPCYRSARFLSMA
ncbi:MAG: hypothetical protein IH861_03115 [Chloroflexi bacterium]|nr:hypothetical protein [Chloroflexota bacterium]